MFVDPPFRRGLLEETINLLEDNGWLADGKPRFMSKAKSKTVCPLFRQTGHYIAVAGQVVYRLYQRWKHKEKVMLINIGRLLMLCVWGF